MSKIFAGELISEELALGMGLAPETAGLSIPLTFMSIGVTTLIHAGKKAHEQRQIIKTADARAEQQRQQAMQRDEERKQQELEQIAQQQERDRLKAEEDARIAEQQRVEAEQQRVEAEQQARQQAQQQAEAQRAQEDQAFQNQMQVRNQAVEDQLALDRARRLTSRNVNVYGYRYENMDPIVNALFPANVGTQEEQKEVWYNISGNLLRLNREDNLPYLDPYRPRAHFDDPNLPYPDGDAGNPDDWNPPNGGGGGNGNPGGNPGGGGYPDNDPAHNNFNQQGRPNRQGGGTYLIGNPFSDVIKAISDKIAQNRERERPAPNPEVDQQPLGSDPATWSPSNPNILGKDGHGQWQYDPNRQPSGDMPGKNGGGIYNPNNPYITKENDDVNLMENELLAIINNQGLSELNQEDIVTNTKQTINELQRLEYQVSGLLPPQAMVGASSVFTSAISRF